MYKKIKEYLGYIGIDIQQEEEKIIREIKEINEKKVESKKDNFYETKNDEIIFEELGFEDDNQKGSLEVSEINEKIESFTEKEKILFEEKINEEIYKKLKSIYENSKLEIKTESIIEQKGKKVYKYIPISKIDVMITPHSRNDELNDKLTNAISWIDYIYIEKLRKFDEERLEYLFKTFNKSRIEETMIEQEQYNIKEPFKIAYEKDVFLEMYYIEKTQRFALLITTEDMVFPEIQYIISRINKYKKTKEEEYIYAGISNVEYSGTLLSREELLELEDILWYFTKDWPITYELYNKKNKYSLEIIGKIDIYNGLNSSYRITLKNKEEAAKKLKFLKAISLLDKKTEKYINFETIVTNKGGLEFLYKDMKFEYEDIVEFLTLNYKKLYMKFENTLEELIIKKEEKINIALEKEKNERKLYILQNQIGLFLNSRKTIFGKFKYFLGKDPVKIFEKEEKDIIKDIEKEKKNKKQKEQNDIEEEEENKNITIEKEKYELKAQYCTIDEFISLYKKYKEYKEKLTNELNDIAVLKQLLKNVEKNKENAIKYIKEISDEKKNIIGFLKYTNKEKYEAIQKSEENIEAKINKTYRNEIDFLPFGESIDKKQRTILSEEEINSVYLAASGMLKYINKNKIKEINEEDLGNYLKDLYSKYIEKYGESEAFNIFGNTGEETRTRYIGEKSFRESDRDLFSVLKYNKNMQKEDILRIIEENQKNIENAHEKINLDIKMDIYKISNWSSKLREEQYDIYNLDINEEEKNIKQEDGTYNLFHIELEPEFKALFLSNIIFYNNINKTLPEGMDITSQLILDMSKYNFVLSNIKKKRIVKIENTDYSVKNINILKYKAYLKK